MKTARVLSKKEKITAASFVAVIIICLIVGVVMLGLFLGGVFGKEQTSLRKSSAPGGFYRYYFSDKGKVNGTYAYITIKSGETEDTFTFFLMDSLAPITVENFVSYANEGFYNGTCLDKVDTENFCVYGGKYTFTDGGYVEKKNKKQAIKGEFSSNVTGDYSYNTLSHFTGVISMARSNNKNSAKSQFFITWQDARAYDGNYAAFGFMPYSEEIIRLREIIKNTKLGSDGYPMKPVMITEVVIKQYPENNVDE